MRLQAYPRFKAFKDDNSPAAGWKVKSYQAGTTTPQDFYADSAGNGATNEIQLDGSGEGDVWLNPSLAYKLVLTDENDVVKHTVDGINSETDGSFSDLTATTLGVSGAIGVGGQIASTVATGTAPLVIASTTKVDNLNVDQLDGKDWTAPGPIGGTTPDTGAFTTLSATDTLDVTGESTHHANIVQQGPNGERCIRGRVSEEITLSTIATTTDSLTNILPANSIIEAVVARVTQAITTATDWKLGDATQAARFCAAQSTTQLNLGATVVGLAHRDPTVANANLGAVQSTAAKLRITTTGTPGSGKIRVIVYYTQFVAPTS